MLASTRGISSAKLAGMFLDVGFQKTTRYAAERLKAGAPLLITKLLHNVGKMQRHLSLLSDHRLGNNPLLSCPAYKRVPRAKRHVEHPRHERGTSACSNSGHWTATGRPAANALSDGNPIRLYLL